MPILPTLFSSPDTPDSPNSPDTPNSPRLPGPRPDRANFLQAPAAAYVHIPFCAAKCGYCDFVSYAGRSHLIPAYIKAVQRDIRQSAALPVRDIYGCEIPKRPLQTVYFGGGTPGDLPASGLVQILESLAEGFGLDPAAEITVEVNPGTASPRLLPTLRAAGFNRLSIGLQTAHDRLLKKLQRRHTVADFVKLVEQARAAGFTNISGDMMLALPGERETDSLYTADFLLRQGLSHLSFYSLTIEPGTPFAELYPNGKGLPSDETERKMYKAALALFKRSGYRHYEVSNVALPGYESRHNLTYWQGLPYYGFGCGAASFVGGFRRLQTADLSLYIEHSGQGTANLEETIGLKEAMAEFFFLGFRTAAGVSAADFERQFGQAWPAAADRSLATLLKRGLIQSNPAVTDGLADGREGQGEWSPGPLDKKASDRHFCLTERGLDFANQVYMEFLDL